MIELWAFSGRLITIYFSNRAPHHAVQMPWAWCRDHPPTPQRNRLLPLRDPYFQGRHLRLAGFTERDVLTFPKAVNNPQNRPPNLSANGSPRGRFNPLEPGAGLGASVGIWGLDSWQLKGVRQAGGVSSGAWSQMPQEKVVNSQHC